MSYVRKNKYRIIPEDSFSVVRNCSGCGGKSIYRNTGNFRVNANGNRIDVWLIYQCEKCKHTYNITIYERQRPEDISSEEYAQFRANSSKLAYRYGTDSSLFARNRAEVNWPDMSYHLENVENQSEQDRDDVEIKSLQDWEDVEIEIVIENPHQLRIRADKLVADYLNVSRGKLKQLQQEERIQILEDKKLHRIQVRVPQVFHQENTTMLLAEKGKRSR